MRVREGLGVGNMGLEFKPCRHRVRLTAAIIARTWRCSCSRTAYRNWMGLGYVLLWTTLALSMTINTTTLYLDHALRAEHTVKHELIRNSLTVAPLSRCCKTNMHSCKAKLNKFDEQPRCVPMRQKDMLLPAHQSYRIQGLQH